MGYRLAHIQRRLLPIAMHLLQRDGQFLMGHDLFLKRVGAAYHAFIEDAEGLCRAKCLEDLQSTTRYVSWSLHTRSRSGLRAMLGKAADGPAGGKGAAAPAPDAPVLEMLENTLWSRGLSSMSEEIVAALVCQIFEGIRDHFVQAVELKFNCFFLMPLIDAFPARLREELEAAYEEDLDDVFDVAAVRAALDARLKALEQELHSVERLQRKFAMIHTTLAQQQSGGGGAPGPDSARLDVENLSLASPTPDAKVAAAKTDAAAARPEPLQRSQGVNVATSAGEKPWVRP